MRSLLAIDPGVSTGWAVFDDRGVLRECRGGMSPPLATFDLVIIERPQIYEARLMKGNPNDIVTLAIQVGRYVERYESISTRVRTVLPSEWKKQVPKQVHHARIFKDLTTGEQGVVDACGRGLNAKAVGDMMDSIGIGKYAITMGWYLT